LFDAAQSAPRAEACAGAESQLLVPFATWIAQRLTSSEQAACRRAAVGLKGSRGRLTASEWPFVLPKDRSHRKQPANATALICRAARFLRARRSTISSGSSGATGLGAHLGRTSYGAARGARPRGQCGGRSSRNGSDCQVGGHIPAKSKRRRLECDAVVLASIDTICIVQLFLSSEDVRQI
jgi:hypothetical protein